MNKKRIFAMKCRIHFLSIALALSVSVLAYVPFMMEDPAISTGDYGGHFTIVRDYSDPRNPAMTVGYTLSAFSHVELKIFDKLGREAASLVDGEQDAGIHEVPYNGNWTDSCLCVYRITSRGYTETRTLVLVN